MAISTIVLAITGDFGERGEVPAASDSSPTKAEEVLKKWLN